MFCTTSVLEKCLGFTKPTWWSLKFSETSSCCEKITSQIWLIVRNSTNQNFSDEKKYAELNSDEEESLDMNSGGKTFATIDPATEEIICQIAEGDKVDVDKAVT